MGLKITKNNYQRLKDLARDLAVKKINAVEIGLPQKKEDLVLFAELMPEVFPLLDQEARAGIWLQNFPYCVVGERIWDHIILNKRLKGEKKKRCQRCRFNKQCAGFPLGYFQRFGEKELRPIADLPMEVMIEIEPNCNLNCQFCFNKRSFASRGRGIENKLAADYVKKIIKQIRSAGIKIVRFTGGEPLLRKDIFDLMAYAKSQKLEVRLNTNGQLVDRAAARKMAGIVDNVLISIESYHDKGEDKLNGGCHSLSKKKTALGLLAKAGIPVLRVGTVGTRKNIRDFDKLEKFVFGLPVKEWELYRPVFSMGNKGNLNSSDIRRLVNKIIESRKKNKIWVSLANAVPFCAISDKNKINAISSGALFEDGHRRLVIDPRGFVKPHYFIDKNIGDPLNIVSAWQHPFMKKIRETKSLLLKCRQCRYNQKCCGGSRYWAKITYGDWWQADPLMIKK